MTVMRPFKRLLSRDEALKIILENVKPIDRMEQIRIEDSIGRVLASDAIAEFNVPPFDRSSMDGYAVKAEDTYGASSFNPKKLKLKGVQHAGSEYEGVLEAEECIQIATGSPVPIGSNAIVMVEYTKLNGSYVEIQRPVYPGSNISPEGEDIKIGESVVKKGEFLTPAKVGALAALNLDTINVYEKPRIAIFSTGSEIKPLGEKLAAGQIYDVNSYTLMSIARIRGCTPIHKQIVPDEQESIEAAIKEATKYDLGVFSGGSSVGARDLFATVVENMGEILFHGLQVKPGKPTLFGIVDGTPIFGMPGYPTSCLSNAYVFLSPGLKRLARVPPSSPKTVKAKMGSRFVSSSGREQFLTVKLDQGVAHIVFKKSGAITSMAHADGYIMLPVNLDVIEEGEQVIVFLLE